MGMMHSSRSNRVMWAVNAQIRAEEVTDGVLVGGRRDLSRSSSHGMRGDIPQGTYRLGDPRFLPALPLACRRRHPPQRGQQLCEGAWLLDDEESSDQETARSLPGHRRSTDRID